MVAALRTRFVRLRADWRARDLGGPLERRWVRSAPGEGWRRNGPVVIGGVGGSGTRVVAAIVQRAGFVLGSDLNHALDNLWFTLLLKRPAWFARFPPDADVYEALRILERALVYGVTRPTGRERALLAGVLAELEDSGRCLGATARNLDTLLESRPPSGDQVGWGFKEPNSHLFLPQLDAFFPGLRYVHVLRHGLDMAFSENTQQVRNWGRRFGVSLPPGGEASATAALDYWIRANTRAREVGSALPSTRCLEVSFDALCADPVGQVRRLLGFLGRSVSEDELQALARLASRPPSSGRHRSRDTSVFRPDQLRAVKALGFAVEP